MGRWKKKSSTSPMTESLPLMRTRRGSQGTHGTMEDHTGGRMTDDEDFSEEEDRLGWLNIIVDAKKKKKGSGLVITDCVLLILQYLQLYALIQSLSLRWPWPRDWLKYSNYIFLANADVWEFLKVYLPDVFLYVQGYFVPSEDLPMDYMWIIIAWGILLVLFVFCYVILYICFTRRKSPKMLIRLSQLKQVFVTGLQVLALPAGIALIRLFHCTDNDLVDVDNTLYCFESTHFAYLAPCVAVLLLIFIAFPAWLIIRAKQEMLQMAPEKHEGYLQLKEMEYHHGMDINWMVGNFHIFASFKQEGAYFRAGHMLVQAVILIVYASGYRYLFYQAVALNCVLFLVLLGCVIVRPYRISALNVMLIVNYLCLNINCLLGCFKTSTDFSTAGSPWLLPNYQTMMLVAFNCFWLLCFVIFVIYLIVKSCCCEDNSLWPQTKFEKMATDTRKYMKGIIISRLLVEKCQASHPMFAPIHEVARYIHIINAYCREAEVLRDPLQHTLWDTLQELIEVHTNIAPRSLFAESTKNSIRKTAEDFMTIMPMFVRRLAQREYDLILVKPIKRRLLLKLYCLSIFLKMRKIQRDRIQITEPAIQKIWIKQDEDESDPGYYEDMYPPKEPIVSQRTYNVDPDVLIRLDEDELSEDDDDVIEQTEKWLQKHGVPKGKRSDPLSDWMEEMGMSTNRPTTVVSEFDLPSDFTIPGLPHLGGGDSQMGSQMLDSRPQSSASTLSIQRPGIRHSEVPRTGSARSLLSPPPGPGSRPSSSQSMTRPRSASPRPGSATPRPPSSQDMAGSIPGAVADNEDLQSVSSRAESAASISRAPNATTQL